MDTDYLSLCDDWQLSTDACQRFSRVPRAQLEVCYDIDLALMQLLGDRQLVRQWLRRPQRPLYHRPPLDLILASPQASRRIRALLLADLSQCGCDHSFATAVLGCG